MNDKRISFAQWQSIAENHYAKQSHPLDGGSSSSSASKSQREHGGGAQLGRQLGRQLGSLLGIKSKKTKTKEKEGNIVLAKQLSDMHQTLTGKKKSDTDWLKEAKDDILKGLGKESGHVKWDEIKTWLDFKIGETSKLSMKNIREKEMKLENISSSLRFLMKYYKNPNFPDFPGISYEIDTIIDLFQTNDCKKEGDVKVKCDDDSRNLYNILYRIIPSKKDPKLAIFSKSLMEDSIMLKYINVEAEKLWTQQMWLSQSVDPDRESIDYSGRKVIVSSIKAAQKRVEKILNEMLFHDDSPNDLLNLILLSSFDRYERKNESSTREPWKKNYDIDIEKWSNIIKDKGRARIITRLKKKAEDWMKEEPYVIQDEAYRAQDPSFLGKTAIYIRKSDIIKGRKQLQLLYDINTALERARLLKKTEKFKDFEISEKQRRDVHRRERVNIFSKWLWECI